MQYSITYTPHALHHLTEIFDYIEKHAGAPVPSLFTASSKRDRITKRL